MIMISRSGVGRRGQKGEFRDWKGASSRPGCVWECWLGHLIFSVILKLGMCTKYTRLGREMNRVDGTAGVSRSSMGRGGSIIRARRRHSWASAVSCHIHDALCTWDQV